MSFTEINNIRKLGKIQEAYQIAREELTKNPSDIWIKRALSWVLYDLLKKLDINFLDYLNEFVELNLLPKEENLIFDKISWQIGSWIHIQNNDSQLDNLFDLIKNLKFEASQGYSFLMKMMLKHKNWNNFSKFCIWWNFSNLLKEDFDYFITQNNQKIMSSAEQLFCAYSNYLLNNQVDKKLIEDFLPHLEKMNDEHKDFSYPPYFLGKLYLKLGQKQKAFEKMIPFVKQKPNDFWVWQTLGDSLEDMELKFSCYCKAIMCNSKAEMMVKLKEIFANLLFENNYFSYAKYTINQVIRIRENKQWAIPYSIRDFINQQWFNQTKEEAIPNIFLQNNAQLILSKALGQVVEIIITRSNFEKNIAHFITSDQKQGFFSYKKILRYPPKILSQYSVIFSNFQEGRKCTLIDIKQNKNDIWKDKISEFNAKIKIAEGNKFAMAGDVFVPYYLLNGLKNGDIVGGKAVKSFDKSKNKDGKTAVTIKKI